MLNYQSLLNSWMLRSIEDDYSFCPHCEESLAMCCLWMSWFKEPDLSCEQWAPDPVKNVWFSFCLFERQNRNDLSTLFTTQVHHTLRTQACWCNFNVWYQRHHTVQPASRVCLTHNKFSEHNHEIFINKKRTIGVNYKMVWLQTTARVKVMDSYFNWVSYFRICIKYVIRQKHQLRTCTLSLIIFLFGWCS